jgi:glycosyltransferase involved in cell wall biosynthesis
MLLRNPFTRDARVLREARSLAHAGHEVTVLALGVPGLEPREDRDGFTILRHVRAGRLAGPTILGAAGNAPPEAGGGNGEAVAAGGSRAARLRRRPGAVVWFRDTLLSRRMRQAAEALPAEVYHAHDLTTLAAAAAAATKHRARLVFDAHELYPELTGLAPGERARWAKLERSLISRPDAIIVPSAARAEEFVRLYGVPSPIVVMNCPPARPAPHPDGSPLAASRRRGELLAVYAGGLSPNRGIDNLIRAVAGSPQVRLAVVGWGPLERGLRGLAGSLGVDDRVTFFGAVEPDDVVPVVAGADVGLAPYLPVGRNNVLAAPNKLIEYLHGGLAVAASDLPDIRRIVREHDVGELFDAADPSSISSALERLRRGNRLVLAREHARAAAPRYTWGAQARELIGVYERLGR